MMLFKLSFKNMKKSFKDYTIYFLTLMLGVAIFYIFNSLDSQTAMLRLTQSTKEIIELLVMLLSGTSVFVAGILGFLIVYASNFLIRRRKEEFGIYMTLGMGRRDISKILLGETILIGCISLAAGLIIGIFGSQFMSILVSKMFEADLSGYTFIYSSAATGKTILYFGIMYLIVMVFNAAAISRFKLIDLLSANKKNEKSAMRSSFLSVLLFITAACILAYCYNKVGFHALELSRREVMMIIGLGILGTFLVFFSLSGFLLKLMQRMKGIYQKGLNAFVLRQVNSSINTAVFSMTIICLLFFVTITVLSAGVSMNNVMTKGLEKNCPVDVNFYLNDFAEGVDADSYSFKNVFEEVGISMDVFDEAFVQIPVYESDGITLAASLEAVSDEVKNVFPAFRKESTENIVSNSDYNRLAELYGIPAYEVEEGKYLMVCDYEAMAELREMAMERGTDITIGDIRLTAQEVSCQEGFLYINMRNSNIGFYVVPDSVVEQCKGDALWQKQLIFSGNYKTIEKEEKQAVEEMLLSQVKWESFDKGNVDGMTKLYVYESSVGLSAVITFITIYIGIIFMIAGAALLSLKELAESSVNKSRYDILSKIGVETKAKHKALFMQMFIFFGLPMLLAVLHAGFGILFVSNIISFYGKQEILDSILFTGSVILIIYGIYFFATYQGSKRIIDEK